MLKQLDSKSKVYCRTGYKMEKMYANQSMRDTNIPFGEIEMICEVALVQKLDLLYVKYSVDRIICYKSDNESRSKEFILTGFKVRLPSDRARE